MALKLPKIVAHRGGGAGDAIPEAPPENTAEAFAWAYALGVRGCECDVQVTRDGRAVVFHDVTLEKLGRPGVRVDALTLEEFSQLDAGSWKRARWSACRVPLLRDVLESLPADKHLMIELKPGPHAANATSEAIEQAGVSPEQLTAISFNTDTLARMGTLQPEVPRLWVIALEEDETGLRAVYKTGESNGQRETMAAKPQAVVGRARSLGVEGLDLDALHAAKLVPELADAGLCLSVWTVNDPQQASALLRVGAHSITTDLPQLMLELLPSDLGDPAP